MSKSNYDDFLVQYEIYETFAYECFRAHTKGWAGYPGIETVSFNKDGIELVYSVYEDEEEILHIPIEFMQYYDTPGVVNYWEQEREKKQKERDKKAKEKQARQDLAEFERLKAKLNK